MTSGPKERFSGRVADYASFRPSFPEELLDALPAGILSPSSAVADIGSGTGILSRQLASRAGAVFCVEPNREMREYSAAYIGDLPNVRIVDGAAEATTLSAASLDAITAGQAFHWFDRPKARAEFLRILRPGGWVVLLWYERLTTGDPFLAGYEALLQRYAVDYREVDHRNITPEIIEEFFRPAAVLRFEKMMSVPMDLEGLIGRIKSSSYVPPPGHPDHAPLIAVAAELFDRHRRDGVVEFRYRTTAYAGRLVPPAG
jgi:SAM-dependent methyltransferase